MANLRETLNKRDGLYCRYCTYVPPDGLKGLVAEHLFPASKGGSDGLANRLLACHECDRFKGAKRPDNSKWVAYLIERRSWVRWMRAKKMTRPIQR